MNDTMVGFGHKLAWLAVRDGEPTAIMAALGLRDLGAVPWREGVDLAYLSDDRLVLTPPLVGVADFRWVLVVGSWLLLHRPVLDTAQLSLTLRTEVQRFQTHRVVGLHRWERAIDGGLVRAFGFSAEHGMVTSWVGEPDGTELGLGLPSSPATDTDTDTDTDTIVVAEADVLRVAAAWSVDPSTLGGLPASGPLRATAVG